jgi:molecular chaperone GrpE
MTEPQDPTQTSEAGTAEPQAADAAAASPAASALQKERDEFYDRLLRKTAEFDNFRKRIDRERKDFTEWAAADVLGDLLAVMDDFDRAVAAPAPPEAQAYKTGVELIHRALMDLVRKRGVVAIETVGTDFDPHRHQAVAYDVVDGAREGEVVEELRKGYVLGERLLRPALVKVARAS